MAEDISNDNDAGRIVFPGQTGDASGQAAILLVESLIHGLIGRSIISTADAVAIVDIAIDAGREIILEYPESFNALSKSQSILEAINSSLKTDIG